ncbi:hypothetical protein [Zhihengliuella flava]|uniref:Uncharacterized protein n=1 Tax=Zhihengliuella flava TaxID=1285193 RepID=A0A931DET4_9MICC|nr:hypothetical protein [Zhihengliuella flava]MBG6085463.1 hypothetical protein [Zhihengliuella flava]
MSVQNELPTGWSRRDFGALHVALPEAWVAVEARGATAAFAHPEVPGLEFRPNVVFRETSYASSLAALSAYSLATSRALFNECHFISHDEVDVDGSEARRQRFTYAGGGMSLVVERFLVVRGGYALEVTTTSPIRLAYEVFEGNAFMLGTLAWDRQGGPHGPGPADADPRTGVREPTYDAWLTELAGHPVEDLSKLPAVQVFASEGPLVDEETSEFLLQQRSRHRLGRFDLLSHRNAVGQLSAAGLMDTEGRFEPTLEMMFDTLRQPEFAISVDGRHGGVNTQLRIFAGAGRAFVLAGAPASELVHGAGAGERTREGYGRLDLIQTEAIPGLIAAWAGVGPAWSVAGNVTGLAAGEFMRGCDGLLSSPPEADAASRRLFEQPWFAWNFEIEGTEFKRSWLNAGSAGHYAVGALENGGTELSPVPSAQVWDVLLQEIGAATIARPASEN